MESRTNRERGARKPPRRPPAQEAVHKLFALADAVSPRLAGVLAHSLYFRVARHAPGAKEAGVMQSARRGTQWHAGMQLPVFEWGPAGEEAVLLLHGWSGYAAQFAALIPALVQAGRRVVAFDAPGHGGAPGSTTHTTEMVAISRAILRERGPFRAVVAHSFGVMVASGLLREVPEALRSAVLISGVFSTDTLLDVFRHATGARPATLKELVRRTEARLCEPWDRYSGERLAASQQVPALFVHDRADREVPSREAERYASTWPAAELLLTDGLGHRRILWDPAVIQRIVAAVDGPAARATSAPQPASA